MRLWLKSKSIRTKIAASKFGKTVFSLITTWREGLRPFWVRAAFDSLKMMSSLWRARQRRGMDNGQFSVLACLLHEKARICRAAVAGSESLAKTQKRVRAALGQKVRHLRRSLELTQADLAGEAGIRRASVISVERGQANPTLDTIVRIAAALKVEPSELLVLDR
ncbi:helix-turn-helix domain-containing protein [Bradyrhizobium sp. B025]|uniref:helix-turn-helix domain-containing protein n=1 Tax=Bradyrhizobium sp. B025 TaxID=3344829 RepID=UPI0035D522B0